MPQLAVPATISPESDAVLVLSHDGRRLGLLAGIEHQLVGAGQGIDIAIHRPIVTDSRLAYPLT